MPGGGVAEQLVPPVHPRRVVLGSAGAVGGLHRRVVRSGQQGDLRALGLQDLDARLELVGQVLVVVGVADADPVAVEVPVRHLPPAQQDDRDVGVVAVDVGLPVLLPRQAVADHRSDPAADLERRCGGDPAADPPAVADDRVVGRRDVREADAEGERRAVAHDQDARRRTRRGHRRPRGRRRDIGLLGGELVEIQRALADRDPERGSGTSSRATTRPPMAVTATVGRNARAVGRVGCQRSSGRSRANQLTVATTSVAPTRTPSSAAPDRWVRGAVEEQEDRPVPEVEAVGDTPQGPQRRYRQQPRHRTGGGEQDARDEERHDERRSQEAAAVQLRRLAVDPQQRDEDGDDRAHRTQRDGHPPRAARRVVGASLPNGVSVVARAEPTSRDGDAGVGAVVEAGRRDKPSSDRTSSRGAARRRPSEIRASRRGPRLRSVSDHDQRPEQVVLLLHRQRPHVQQRRGCRAPGRSSPARRGEVPVGDVAERGQRIRLRPGRTLGSEVNQLTVYTTATISTQRPAAADGPAGTRSP